MSTYFLTDKELYALNRRGWIPGPGETEVAFLERVRLYDRGGGEGVCSIGDGVTSALFDFSVPWLSVVYDLDRLFFWQGGMTSIAREESSIKEVAVQLNSQSRRFCSLSELVAHEAVHVARMGFDRDPWEEHFAYATSQRAYRRYWGPLFQFPWEGTLFCALSLVGVAVQPLLFWFDLPSFVSLLPSSIPLLLLLFFGGRLVRVHRSIERCRRLLESCMCDGRSARNLLFRLTSKEIALFSRWNVQQVTAYLVRERGRSLRGRLLALYFFNRCSDFG